MTNTAKAKTHITLKTIHYNAYLITRKNTMMLYIIVTLYNKCQYTSKKATASVPIHIVCYTNCFCSLRMPHKNTSDPQQHATKNPQNLRNIAFSSFPK